MASNEEDRRPKTEKQRRVLGTRARPPKMGTKPELIENRKLLPELYIYPRPKWKRGNGVHQPSRETCGRHGQRKKSGASRAGGAVIGRGRKINSVHRSAATETENLRPPPETTARAGGASIRAAGSWATHWGPPQLPRRPPFPRRAGAGRAVARGACWLAVQLLHPPA